MKFFSFSAYEKPDPAFWEQLLAKLPEGYSYPDLSFLRTLDPELSSLPYVMDRSCLNPDLTQEDGNFWESLSAKLPQEYRIPDAGLIKRLFEL
ncbi:hypothetical protein [Paenibacillus macerans]|uniref:hypothetical protein n=1 Tax=Paenibacillus macerans TaxID=44252 RepID=UPI00203B04BE|nr:hypothetical protein [Paenibacillus macerans]MCM3700442.1 hypothetical protein [Paenibacillus macerans]